MVSTAQQSRTRHRAPEIWAASCCRASPEDQLDVLCPSSTPVAPRLPSSSSGVFCLTVCPGHSILVLAVNFQECTSCTPRLTAEDRFLNLSSFPLFLLLRAGWSGWGDCLGEAIFLCHLVTRWVVAVGEMGPELQGWNRNCPEDTENTCYLLTGKVKPQNNSQQQNHLKSKKQVSHCKPKSDTAPRPKPGAPDPRGALSQT